MAYKDSRLITVRRRTVVRAGIVLLVLSALGVGITIGLVASSQSSPPTTKSTNTGISTTPAHPLTTTTTSPPTTVTPLPGVLSCGPGSTAHIRPTKLTIGCGSGLVTVTDISWSQWGSVGGGQGRGTLNVGLMSAAAIVVVFHDVNGIYQDVSITPSKNVPTTPSTARTRATTTTSTIPLTTSTAGGLSPIAASQPGSGWGGD